MQKGSWDLNPNCLFYFLLRSICRFDNYYCRYIDLYDILCLNTSIVRSVYHRGNRTNVKGAREDVDRNWLANINHFALGHFNYRFNYGYQTQPPAYWLIAT